MPPKPPCRPPCHSHGRHSHITRTPHTVTAQSQSQSPSLSLSLSQHSRSKIVPSGFTTPPYHPAVWYALLRARADCRLTHLPPLFSPPPPPPPTTATLKARAAAAASGQLPAACVCDAERILRREPGAGCNCAVTVCSDGVLCL